jgi:hypothetical protein
MWNANCDHRPQDSSVQGFHWKALMSISSLVKWGKTGTTWYCDVKNACWNHPTDRRLWRTSKMTTPLGKLRNLRKTHSNGTLSTINSTGTTLKMNVGLQSQASKRTVRLTTTQLTTSSPPLWKPSIHCGIHSSPCYIISQTSSIQSPHSHPRFVYSPLQQYSLTWFLYQSFWNKNSATISYGPFMLYANFILSSLT